MLRDTIHRDTVHSLPKPVSQHVISLRFLYPAASCTSPHNTYYTSLNHSRHHSTVLITTPPGRLCPYLPNPGHAECATPPNSPLTSPVLHVPHCSASSPPSSSCRLVPCLSSPASPESLRRMNYTACGVVRSITLKILIN